MSKVPDNLVWRKSSFSGGSGGNCVEIAVSDGVIAVRNSKNPTGLEIAFTTAEWDAFLKGVKVGEFDLDTKETSTP